MNFHLLDVGCMFLGLAFILGMITHNWRPYGRDPVDDTAWAAGLVGAAFVIAAIVSIWV